MTVKEQLQKACELSAMLASIPADYYPEIAGVLKGIIISRESAEAVARKKYEQQQQG